MDGILSIIFFLVVLVVPNGASHAASPAEAYWKTVLPYTPMPTVIQALLGSDAKVSSFSVRPDAWTRYRTTYTMHAGDVTENKAHGDPMRPLFFFEKDLRPGATFNLQLTGFVPSVKFLARATARAIPFSTERLPEILGRFSIKPESPEAEVVKNTLSQCEDGAATQEAICATSLESMVDFATSDLGTHRVKVLATTAEKPSIPKQKYTVASPGAKAERSSKMVACHAEPYPYAMFICHSSKLQAKAYAVPLVGEDGAKVEAVAVCHIDTSKMDPDYIGFQVLNVKPGTVPVCHFLPQGSIIWASAN